MLSRTLKTTGFGLLLALVGAGCGAAPVSPVAGNNNPSPSTTGQAADTNSSAGAAYNDAVDIPVPQNDAAINGVIQGVIDGVFGKTKVISLLSMTEQNFSAQYQATRVTTGNDVPALSKALQDKGYEITSISTSDGQGSVLVSKGSQMIEIQFQLGGSTVNGSVISN